MVPQPPFGKGEINLPAEALAVRGSILLVRILVLDGVALWRLEKGRIRLAAFNISQLHRSRTSPRIVVNLEHRNHQLGRDPCLMRDGERLVVAHAAHRIGRCEPSSSGLQAVRLFLCPGFPALAGPGRRCFQLPQPP